MLHAGAQKSSFLDNAFGGGSGLAPPAIRGYLLVPKLPHRRHNCPARFKEEEARRPPPEGSSSCNQKTVSSPTALACVGHPLGRFGRVEDGRGNWGPMANAPTTWCA